MRRRDVHILAALGWLLWGCGAADPIAAPTDSAPSVTVDTQDVGLDATTTVNLTADGDAASAMEVEAWVEPNTTSVLAAWVRVETDVPVTVQVAAWRGANLDWESAESAPETSHRVAVLGMRPATDYDLALSLRVDGVEVGGAVALTFTTEGLSATLPPITVSTHDPARSAGGVTLFGPQMKQQEDADPSWPLYLGVDMAGVPVWSYQDVDLDHDFVTRDVTRLDDGHLVLLLDEGVRIVTVAGELVHEWREQVDDASSAVALGGRYHHDAIVLPSGNVIALGNEVREIDVPVLEGVVEVRGDVLREVDRFGAQIWSWNAFDHLTPLVLPGPLSFEPNPKGGFHDWTHGNAIVFEEATDTLLVSLRHQNQVIRIDRSSGEVIARIGPGGDHTLSSGEWFYSQHAPEMGSDGSLLIYDNGNERVDEVSGEHLPKPERYSRAVRYVIDADTKTAAQVWSYQTPEFTTFVGDADRLDNGNILVCAGGVRGANSSNLARLHEVTSSTSAEVVWALEIEAIIYRATRLSGLSL